MKRNYGPFILISSAALAVFLLLTLAPAIAQNQEYHAFADQRRILGIPNFWNVISNIPFALVGVLGLRRTSGAAGRVLFAGVLLTCFGSAYYHLAPDDARLVWDRVPMTLAFMAMVAIVLGQRVGPGWSDRLVLPVAFLGAASVWWWHVTANLTPYILVQFGTMLVLLVATLFDRNLRGLWPVLGLYVLAKLAELYDRAIYAVLPLSGHTWKHLLASLAAFGILRWWCSAKLPDARAQRRGEHI
jgi:ceramidase